MNGIPLDKALEQFVLKNLFGKEPEPDEEADDDEAGDEVAVSDEKNSYDGTLFTHSLTHSLAHSLTYLLRKY